MKRLTLALLITACTSPMASATGLYTCDSEDKSTWQSIETLEKKLADEGWKVRKVKEDGGCYEVYATTPEGQRGEAYFHPQTLELELLARRGQVLFQKSE